MDVDGTSHPSTVYYNKAIRKCMEKLEMVQAIAHYTKEIERLAIKMARDSETTISSSTSTGTQPIGLSFKNSILQREKKRRRIKKPHHAKIIFQLFQYI